MQSGAPSVGGAGGRVRQTARASFRWETAMPQGLGAPGAVPPPAPQVLHISSSICQGHGCPGLSPLAWHSGPIPTQGSSFLLIDVGSVEGLAYHRGWDTLYWTSYTTSTITRHTVDQTRTGAFERETVITMSGDDHPRAFVLDECQK